MITFTRAAYDAVVSHANDRPEREICGILAGEFDEQHTTVMTSYRATNVADQPERRYYIDPEEQLEIIETLEAAGHEVAGFYHSHPAGPTQPSGTDADRATWPGLSYVIVALDGHPYVGSWRWRDAAFEQEIVRIG